VKKYLLPILALSALAGLASAHGHPCHGANVRRLELVYPFQPTVALSVYVPASSVYAAPVCPLQAVPKAESVPAPKPAAADPVPVVPVDPPSCPQQPLLVQSVCGYGTARIVRFHSAFYGNVGHVSRVLVVDDRHFVPAANAVQLNVAGRGKVKVVARGGSAAAVNASGVQVNVAGGAASAVAVKARVRRR
jgi:hypothetical protein